MKTKKIICMMVCIVISLLIYKTDIFSNVLDKFIVNSTDKFDDNANEDFSINDNAIKKTIKRKYEVGNVSGLVVCKDSNNKLYATNSICRDIF